MFFFHILHLRSGEDQTSPYNCSDCDTLQTGLRGILTAQLGLDTPSDCSHFDWIFQGVGSRHTFPGPSGGGNLPPCHRHNSFHNFDFCNRRDALIFAFIQIARQTIDLELAPVSPTLGGTTHTPGFDFGRRRQKHLFGSTGISSPYFHTIFAQGVGSQTSSFTGPSGSGNLPLYCNNFYNWDYIDQLSFSIGVGSHFPIDTGLTGGGNLPPFCNSFYNLALLVYNFLLGVGSWFSSDSGLTGGGNLPPFCNFTELLYRDDHFHIAACNKPLPFEINCRALPTIFRGLDLGNLDLSCSPFGLQLNGTWYCLFLCFFLLLRFRTIIISWILFSTGIDCCLRLLWARCNSIWQYRELKHFGIDQHLDLFDLSFPEHFALTNRLSTRRHCSTNNGSPGPKSRHRSLLFSLRSARIFHCFGVFLLLYCALQGSVRGEGCILVMEDTEASTTWQHAFFANCGAKSHEPRPEASRHAPSWHAATSKVVKRSIKRAYKRAVALGTTWYRGRCYRPDDFPKGLQYHGSPDFIKQTSKINPTLTKCHLNNQDHRRVNVLTWNPGGLSAAKLDEVKTWMLIQNVSIAILPETRWTYENEWTDDHWHHIHTGSASHRGMGILCILSKKLCSQNDIRWLPVIPGRLVHIQVRQSNRFLDIIGCYQHTQAHHKQRQTDRGQFWSQLDRLLGTLATRHSLVLAGDMNCSLPQLQSHSGPREFKWKGKMHSGSHHADAGQFMSILRMHGLTALNTWDPSCGPSYIQGTSCSRIDYLITRMQHADGLAKRTTYAWDAPFCETSGHAPLLSTIRKHWFPAAPAMMATTIGKAQRQEGHKAFRLQSPEWTDFTHDVGARLHARLTQASLSDHGLISDLHEIAIESFHDYFPRMSKPQKPPDAGTVSVVLTKWQHRQRLLSLTTCNLSSLFQGWFHSIRLQQLKRASQIQARQVRKLRFSEIVAQAESAARRHDTHALFQLINRYSPAQVRRRVQLRNSHGQIATPIEEAAMLKRFVSDTWHGPATFPVEPCPDPGLPFTAAQLERALREIPASKAVARPCSPGFIWKSVAPIIAPALFDKLLEWWDTPQPYIPTWFKLGWMVMLPKPLKPPMHPSALRPIALQEPVGKAVVGLLASRALKEAFPDLAQLPSWAYMPFRSTQDALLRVAQHCRSVRTLMASQRSTPFTRSQATSRHKIAGGISIFLDIERAFDRVDRMRLFAKLASIGVHPKIIQLLSLWHQETSYSLICQGIEEPIQVGRGLRQGCKAAPFLWNCQIHAFLSELERRTTTQWVRICVNFYADDGQMGNTFDSIETLQQLMKNLCITLELMTEFGLTINPQKCVALLSITGSSCRQMRNSMICRHQGTDWLKISAEDHQSFQFPIATQAKYLGTIMSHARFEDSTTKHRIQLSKIAFGRLHRWLTGSGGLTTRQRLKLWSTCIYPVLSYGLCAIGITSTGLQRIQQHMYMTIRQLLRDHAYLTGHSHFQAFCLQNVDQPVAWLWKTADGLQRSVAQRLTRVYDTDIIQTLDWTHLEHLKLFLMAQTAQNVRHAPGPEVSPATAATEAPIAETEHHCQLCDFATFDVSQFRRHCTTQHGLRMNRCLHIDPTKYSLNGLPQCRYCYQSFTTWRQFIIHAQRGCQVLCAGPAECWTDSRRVLQADPALPATMFAPQLEAPVRGKVFLTDSDLQNVKSQPWGPRVLTIVGTRNWHHMKKEREACQYLAKRCCLCDHFFGRAQELHHHIQTMHPEFWPHTMSKGKLLTNIYGEDTPCPFCGEVFRNCHQCTVWTQISLLLVNGGGCTEAQAETSITIRTCDICNETFSTPELLNAHLVQDHRLISSSFNPARDCVDGEPACIHCGTLYDNVESLRSHINQGRCDKFDPSLPTEVVAVRDIWKQALCSGQLANILRDPHNRLQLTLRCQHCALRFHRATDMSGHLISAHSQLWSAAQGLTQILVALLYEQTGCLCNPSVTQARAFHVCVPLRQLSMLFLRLQDVILFPHTPTDAELATLMSQRIERSSRFMMERLLTDQQLSQLWTNDAVMALLRDTCLLCGDQHGAADLHLHMYEAHKCGTPLVKFYIQQLLPFFMHVTGDDHRCHACLQVFSASSDHTDMEPDPVQQAEAQTHFRAQCPCILQAAIFLAKAAHGRHGNGSVRGSRRTDLGGLSTLDADVGQQPEADTERPSQAPKKRKSAAGQSRATRSRHGDQGQDQPGKRHDAHGQACHPTRSRDAAAEERGHLHLLFRQQRERGQSAFAGESDGNLGPGSTGPQGEAPNSATATAETEIGLGPFSDPADQDQPIGGGTGQFRHQEGGDSQQGVAARPNMPLLGVEPRAESPAGEPEEAAHSETSAFSLQRHAGGPSGSQHCGEVPCPSEHAELRGLSLEDAGQSSGRPTMAGAPGDVTSGHLALGGVQFEAAQPSPELPGLQLAAHFAAPQSHAGQREGQEQGQIAEGNQGRVMSPSSETGSADPRNLLLRLSRLTLENPGNLCFANATVYALLWTTLSCTTWQADFWGEQRTMMQSFLEHTSDTCSQICTEEWFLQILRCWGTLDPQAEPSLWTQQDSAEFVSHWLLQMGCNAFDMRWERRYEQNGCIHVADSSARHVPLHLQFDSMYANLTQCNLTPLFRLWCQANGMIAALVEAPVCLCVHLDRTHQDENGHVRQSECKVQVDDFCLVPKFIDAERRTEMVEYRIIALTAHVGEDQAGHYRSALRIAPSLPLQTLPAEWLLTEDWQRPSPVWHLPHWLRRSATMYWMIRSDCVHLLQYTNPGDLMQDQTAQILALLPLPTNENTNDRKTCDEP